MFVWVRVCVYVYVYIFLLGLCLPLLAEGDYCPWDRELQSGLWLEKYLTDEEDVGTFKGSSRTACGCVLSVIYIILAGLGFFFQGFLQLAWLSIFGIFLFFGLSVAVLCS